MRPRIIVAAIAAAAGAVALAGTMLATDASAGAAVAPSATSRVVVRPVTSSGHVADGFTAKREHGGSIDCTFPSPSVAAVDKNILECSPSAEYAVACWKSAQAKRALCLRNPTSDGLAKIRYHGKFAKTDVPKPHQTAPLRLVLANGTKCSLRDGGAGPTLKHHPSWAATFYCTGADSGLAVWAPEHSRHLGIDESSSSWTVHVAKQSGHQKVVVRHVAKAYFVGTAS